MSGPRLTASQLRVLKSACENGVHSTRDMRSASILVRMGLLRHGGWSKFLSCGSDYYATDAGRAFLATATVDANEGTAK